MSEIYYSAVKDEDYRERDVYDAITSVVENLMDAKDLDAKDLIGEIVTIYQGEVNPKKASAYFSIDGLFDHMACWANDDMGEDGDQWPDCTKEQEEELENKIKICIDKWADIHGGQPTFGIIENVKEIKAKVIGEYDYEIIANLEHPNK